MVDASIVLTLVLNEDPLAASLLGALDLAARITSASLARQDALRVSVGAVPVPSRGGGRPGVAFSFQLVW